MTETPPPPGAIPGDEGVALRTLPALPAADPTAGKIRWDSWEQTVQPSHIDTTCPQCAFPGPPMLCLGRTWHRPEPTWVRLERSSARPRRPSRWARTQPPARWTVTHFAIRCPACDEMSVRRRADDTEIHYHPPRTESHTSPTWPHVLE